MRLVGNGGGLVYAPLGPTHQAIEDIAVMRAIPNMTVLETGDATEVGVAVGKIYGWNTGEIITT